MIGKTSSLGPSNIYSKRLKHQLDCLSTAREQVVVVVVVVVVIVEGVDAKDQLQTLPTHIREDNTQLNRLYSDCYS